MAEPPKEWIEELDELLRIPSVSADPELVDEVVRAAEWVRNFIRAAGGEAELVATEKHPLVIGEFRASEGADDAPTVIAYGHFDVQPEAPLELWESPPFEPTVRDGWLYARGVADDKGQLYILLKAAALLAAEGELPVNVRFTCDGEEESGGHSIIDFLEADERGGDACVIFDGNMLAPGKPAFFVATRGIAYFHVRVRTGEKDLHSGVFGGAALNASHVLLQVLGAVLPRDGQRAGAAARRDRQAERRGDRELERARAGRRGARRAGRASGRSARGGGVLPAYVRRAGRRRARRPRRRAAAPEDRDRGRGRGERVDPARARSGREGDRGGDGAADARSRARGGRRRDRVDRERAGALVRPDDPAIKLGQDAFERVIGARPLLIRIGGSLPVMAALESKQIPTILTGFDLPDGNIHSPNERFRVDHIALGVETAKELFRSLGELR